MITPGAALIPHSDIDPRAHFVQMCLMPGAGNILVPPSEKASSYAPYFKLLLVLHFAIACLEMVLGLWSTGLMCVLSSRTRSDIMLVIVGFMSVRYPFGFAISQLLCYTMMTGFNLFFNCMNTILAFAQVKTITGTAWQQSMYKTILLAAVVVYFAACLIAYRIYSELRLSLPEDPAHAEAGYDPYGGLVNQAAGAAEERQPQQQQRNVPNSYASQPPAAASSSASASGFRPFTGTGYRLGSA